MNFFEQQERARRNTRHLVLLFLAAVVALIVLIDLVVAAALMALEPQAYPSLRAVPADIHVKVVLAVAVAVAAASLYRLYQLRGGGDVVAQALGGRRITPRTTDPDERKLLNVVEEMSIASGTPVPPVYLIDDSAINAFAAGYTPHDAVIGVTRGAVELLNRDELQGVIAHEFSHVFNGDMRLNLRLIGILFGIVFLTLIGERIMRAGAYSRRQQGVALVLGGLALTVIGYIGMLFASMIKAAVSRQREYLADASAVQYTRNPDGIGGALKKIGGWAVGSRLGVPNAAEYSHFYIAQGVSTLAEGLFATHPPLERRIRKIDSRWDGSFPKVSRPRAQAGETGPSAAGPRLEAASLITAAALAEAIADTGQPNAGHLEQARHIIAHIPARLIEAARDPLGAWSVALGLILPGDTDRWDGLLEILDGTVDFKVVTTLRDLLPELASLDTRYRLPLIELCMPGLKMLDASQRREFKESLKTLIAADGKVELREWALYRLLTLSLDSPEPSGPLYGEIRQVRQACRLVLATVAYGGADTPEDAQAAYRRAASNLQLDTELPAKSELKGSALERALKQIRRLKPLKKPAFLKALCAAAEHDGMVTAEEVELIRAVAESIDCPMPPLQAG